MCSTRATTKIEARADESDTVATGTAPAPKKKGLRDEASSIPGNIANIHFPQINRGPLMESLAPGPVFNPAPTFDKHIKVKGKKPAKKQPKGKKVVAWSEEGLE